MQGTTDSRVLQQRETARTEAAAGLERKMAAMQVGQGKKGRLGGLVRLFFFWGGGGEQCGTPS